MAGQQEDGKKVEQWRDARVGWDDVKRGPNPGLLEGNRGDPQQEITSLPQEVCFTGHCLNGDQRAENQWGDPRRSSIPPFKQWQACWRWGEAAV